MAVSPNKQIVIDGEIHERLKAHIKHLGLPSIKEYVESLIEHAIATTRDQNGRGHSDHGRGTGNMMVPPVLEHDMEDDDDW